LGESLRKALAKGMGSFSVTMDCREAITDERDCRIDWYVPKKS
jgi:hypothetical protein